MAGWTSRQRMLALWVTVVTTLRYVRNYVLTASILRPQLFLLIAVQHHSCMLHDAIGVYIKTRRLRSKLLDTHQY